jgi:ribosomal protein S8E
MAIDFSTVVYLHCMDTFARDATIYPVVSQPTVASYYARGILDTRGTTIQTDAGMVVMSDQETIFDIRESEFGGIPPVQGDQIDIPADSGIPAAGMFEITDAAWNGGGEITLTIRSYVAPTQTFTLGKQS